MFVVRYVPFIRIVYITTFPFRVVSCNEPNLHIIRLRVFCRANSFIRMNGSWLCIQIKREVARETERERVNQCEREKSKYKRRNGGTGTNNESKMGE